MIETKIHALPSKLVREGRSADFYKNVAEWYMDGLDKSNDLVFGIGLLCFVVFPQYSSCSPLRSSVSLSVLFS